MRLLENPVVKSPVPEQISIENYPNPSNDQTNITCFIPEGSGKAFLNLYDCTGKLLRSLELLEGENHLKIDLSWMESGTYLYGLSINGALVQSKKFVVLK